MCVCVCFFFQAEDGIRDLVRSRGLGDVYKRQLLDRVDEQALAPDLIQRSVEDAVALGRDQHQFDDLSLIHI